MWIEIGPTELEDLREAVRSFNQGLTTELAHTDHREFREMLKEKSRRFERLRAHLAKAAADTQLAAPNAALSVAPRSGGTP